MKIQTLAVPLTLLLTFSAAACYKKVPIPTIQLLPMPEHRTGGGVITASPTLSEAAEKFDPAKCALPDAANQDPWCVPYNESLRAGNMNSFIAPEKDPAVAWAVVQKLSQIRVSRDGRPVESGFLPQPQRTCFSVSSQKLPEGPIEVDKILGLPAGALLPKTAGLSVIFAAHIRPPITVASPVSEQYAGTLSSPVDFLTKNIRTLINPPPGPDALPGFDVSSCSDFRVIERMTDTIYDVTNIQAQYWLQVYDALQSALKKGESPLPPGR